jgi:hypothetical protein
MATAPGRQPRVGRVLGLPGPAARGAAWLVGTGVALCGALLIPLTGVHLFPSRAGLPGSVPAASASPAPGPADGAAAPDRAVSTSPAGGGNAAADPDAAAPQPAPDAAPSGTFSTGLIKVTIPINTELPSIPAAGLAAAPPPSAATSGEPAAPVLGTTPVPRGPLPLQTELIVPAPTNARAAERPAATRAGGNGRPDAAAAPQRRG